MLAGGFQEFGHFATDLMCGDASILQVAEHLAEDVLVAGLVGAGIPVVLKALNQDPAVASNIFLTLITDIVGFASFLLTAAILLS